MLVQPGFAHAQRNQIGLGEIAIVVRVFLAAHADGFAGIRVEQARFLHHPAAAFEDAHLPLDLLIHGQFQKAERVQILDLGLGAELFRALADGR